MTNQFDDNAFTSAAYRSTPLEGETCSILGT
jgi:hypothetical protein